MGTKPKKDLKQVQDQYLDYPYPTRDPDDDKKRVLRIEADFLAQINHYLYKGKQDFKNGFRVLVAGGGTGDSTVWLAKQLMEYPNAEVVYLDFSKVSMGIAKKRAINQGVTNITWIEDSILNIPDLGLGKFDYVNCVGVLHHLKNPDLGLRILSDVLKEDGGAMIMVYGQYGRTGIYHTQELLRMTGKGVEDRQEEVDSAWDVINSLPKTNWAIRGSELQDDVARLLACLYKGDEGQSYDEGNDIELYDLLLHKQDRAYTIPQLYELIENADMNVVEFTEPHVRAILNIESYFKDSDTKERIKEMPLKEQQAICELMSGNVVKHSLWISKQKNTAAIFDDLDNIPVMFNAGGIAKKIVDFIEKNESQVMNKVIPYTFQKHMNLSFSISFHTKSLFKFLDAGDKTFHEIFELVRQDTNSKASDQQLWDELIVNLAPLCSVGALLLRHKSIRPFNNFYEEANQKKYSS